MKRSIALLSILAIVALCFSGCGGSATSNASAQGGKAVIKVVNGGVEVTNADGSRVFIPSQTVESSVDGGSADVNTKTDGTKIF